MIQIVESHLEATNPTSLMYPACETEDTDCWERSQLWLAEREKRREADNFYAGEAGAKAAQQAAADIGFSVFASRPLASIPPAGKTEDRDSWVATAEKTEDIQGTLRTQVTDSPTSMIPECSMELPPALMV